MWVVVVLVVGPVLGGRGPPPCRMVYQKVYRDKVETVCKTVYDRKCDKKVTENCYVVPQQT